LKLGLKSCMLFDSNVIQSILMLIIFKRHLCVNDWGPIKSFNAQFDCVKQCLNNGQVVVNTVHVLIGFKE
jgi:hypothetical protein